MQHLGTKVLETERLILRPFSPMDAEAMFRNWASDPEVTKYLTWPTHKDAQATRWVLTDWENSYEKRDFYQWAITVKKLGDDPIGCISVVASRDDIGMVQIGYCIGREYWHQGITSEALREVIRFFFDEVGVSRIEGRHDPRNPHSGAVMKKCGMHYEGTMRQADRNNQGICDISYYAVLASDER